MGVKNFSLALQNGIVYHCGYVENNALYNDILQNGSSSGTVKVYGTLADIKNIIGEEPFSVPLNVSKATDAQWHSGQEIFFSTFRSVYESNGTGSGDPPTWILTTNGLFNARIDKITKNNLGGAYSVGPNYYYNNAGYGRSPMRTYLKYYVQNEFTTIVEPVFYVNVLNDRDYLNCTICYISIQYSTRDNANIWTVKYYKDSETYLENINRQFSNPYKDVILNYLNNVEPDHSDPYAPGGYSGTGGGDPQKQNWSEDSDYVKEDAMPDETNYGATSTGLITIFTPTKAQLQKLSDVIWGRSFWQWVQSLIQNIDDLFISLGMVPFTITPGDTVEVTWLNFVVAGAVSFTDIYLNKCPSQFMEFDMGSISLNGSDNRIFASDSALDYSPYSKLGIYLPFIGYQELDIDECRGEKLHLKYRIDVLSGTTVALLSLREQNDDPETSRTIYQFTGNCLTQLPITSADYQTMVTNAVNLGLSLTSAGATAAVASAGDFAALGFAGENMSAAQAALESTKRSASVANAGGGAISSSANAIMGMKPNFKKSGGIGASSSLLSVKQPYLFLTTPRQSMPEGYNKVCGFPCNIYGNLGTFSGFTVVEDIRLNGLVATSPEVEEIYHLLKTGVII